MVLFFCLTTLQNWQNCPAALTNHSGFLSIQLGFFRTSRGGANILLFCTQNRMWNSKTLAVFVLKMTGAFALGGKKKSSIL